jgi:CSLREA domain-containing protein/uncharacterized repeat protein (TIGR01451 family)
MGARGALGLVLAAVLATGLVGAQPALADATFNVTTTRDLPAANPVNGCATAGGPCSLRSAIQAADALPAGSGNVTINVPAGNYALTIPPVGSDDASTGDLNITYGGGTVTVAGAGASSTALDAGAVDRAFNISSAALVTISGLTIKNGNPDSSELNNGTTCPATQPTATATGGAILTVGGLTLTGDVVTDSISAGDGGGVEDSGTAPVTISHSQITDNVACASSSFQSGSIGFGGGVEESGGGPLTIDHSTVSDNQAASDGGGVIENSQNASQPGSVTITDSTLDGNSTTGGDGGAVSSEGTNGSVSGTVALSRDTISANSASGFGGGVSSRDPLTVTDSTLTGNTAGRDGGGLASVGYSATVSFSTIDANSAGGSGGDLGNGGEGGQVNVDDSIVTAGTAAGAPSLCTTYGVSSNGHNLFSDDGSSCGTAAGNGDVLSADPQLGPLQDNGGPTQTQALKPTSPAIDAASSPLCSSETVDAAGQPVDQRGVSRPQGSGCDIGAYEYGAADLALSASVSPTSIQTSGSSTLTETVTNSGPTPATDAKLSATIPSGLQAGTPTASQGTCTVTSGTVSCALGTVNPGGTGLTVSVPLSATATGSYSLPASVTLDQSDATPADNQATAKLTVNGPAQTSPQPSSSGTPSPAPVVQPLPAPAPPTPSPAPVVQPLSAPVPPIANPVATRLGGKYSREFKLDGTASTDPNKGGRIVSYQWSSNGKLVSTKATFDYKLASGVEKQSFTLKVISSENLSDTARVSVSPRVAPVIRITVDTVHFCENCYNLSNSAIAIIDRVRHYLQGAKSLRLVASCDKYASVEYNVWLAQERALAVKNRLLRGRHKVPRTYLVILGKTHPLKGADQNTALGRYLNRRVTIIITP